MPEAEWQKRQFDACAERIGLSAGERAWVLAEVKWARRSNAPPTMADLWVFARPRA